MKLRLMNDLKDAMKNKDNIRKNTIQMIRAQILQTEKDSQKELSDDDILKIISKQLKQKNEALEQFEKADRQDLIEQTNKEISVLKEYMPEMVDVSEIAVKAVEFKVARNYEKKDMGKLIKDLKEFYGVRANGKDIATVASQILS